MNSFFGRWYADWKTSVNDRLAHSKRVEAAVQHVEDAKQRRADLMKADTKPRVTQCPDSEIRCPCGNRVFLASWQDTLTCTACQAVGVKAYDTVIWTPGEGVWPSEE